MDYFFPQADWLIQVQYRIADAWSVESSPNDVIIIHTHNEVIVAFQHGSQM
jgi:hypothetical protein